MHPIVATGAENRHNVGVVQNGRYVRLDLELRQLLATEPGVDRQSLESRAPPPRNLLSLVDNPHACATKLPNQEVFTQIACSADM
jgi:hypothetical protein